MEMQSAEGDTSVYRRQALQMSKQIRHRGPDWSGIYQGKTAILAHERLSIVDPASGGQPLISADGKHILCVNGEIYNHRELREVLKNEYEFQTGSDCEVILALYKKKGINFLEDLNGIFAPYDEETIRKLRKLYLYDCLRANKSLCAWGVEGRVPFLDKKFLDVAMRLNPTAKMCPGEIIEKKILREAFSKMLPHEIVWRQKEQFSDGVGYNWIDTLKKIATEAVSDNDMLHATKRFPINPPQNKEEYYYRSIFEEHFPSECAARSVPSVPSVACSTAEALVWDTSFKNRNDPSGRSITGIHKASH